MNDFERQTLASRLAAAGICAALALPLLAQAAPAAPEDHKVNLSAVDAKLGHQRFIVGFDEATRGNSEAAGNAVAAVARGKGVGLQLGRQLATGAHVVEASSKLPEQAATAVMRAFARRSDVVYVEPDALMRPALVPNDPDYPNQWHYHSTPVGMNLPDAWDIATGQGVVVAVIDTGQTSHPDLNGQYVAGYDFIATTDVSRDGDGRDSDPADEGDWESPGDCGSSPGYDSSWHGTHVAGTVAAATDNNLGVAGVAHGAMLQHVRVLGHCGGYLSDISDAIVWASGGTVAGVPANATPAQVINMSLGGFGSCGITYQNAIDSAVSRGVTVAVAAGNSSANTRWFRPANCENVITVAASNIEGDLAWYSNSGLDVEITAPGGETPVNGVLSTLNDGPTVPGNPSYEGYQGTSMASPHIAGLAALMYSVDPSLTPAQISQLMQANAAPLPGSCTNCGAGLADAAATLAALSDPPTGAPYAPSDLTVRKRFERDGDIRILTSVTLGWTDNAINETAYEIEYCIQERVGWVRVCEYLPRVTLPGDSQGWTDDLEGLTTVSRYRIRAINDDGESDWLESRRVR